MTERPDWMVPGAEVAIISSRGFAAGTANLEFTTIERVLKRDVVLSNKERFNANSPWRSRGAWDGRVELLPADHPRVIAAQVANDRDQRAHGVENALDIAVKAVREWRHSGNDEQRLRALDAVKKASANLDLTKEV